MKNRKLIIISIMLISIVFGSIHSIKNVKAELFDNEVLSTSIDTTLVDLNSTWQYYDYEEDPVLSGERTAWTNLDFDTSNWKTSASGIEAKFGSKNGQLKSINSNMPTILLNQYKENSEINIEAFFFRTVFNVQNVDENLYLMGELLYDDAALVYLNGELIAEYSNQQADDDSKKIDQNMQYGGDAGSVSEGKFTISASKLVEGDNILAIELHQANETSSDIYFQMTSLIYGEYIEEQKTIVLTVGADETSRNITWYCNDLNQSVGKVQYAKKNGEDFPSEFKEVDATVLLTSDSGYYSNKVELENLDENCEYVYRLINDDIISDVYSFKTTSKDDFSFLAVGDPQIGASSTSADSKNWKNTLDKAIEKYPNSAFLISAGDQVNNDENESQYEAFLNSTLTSSLPIATSVGNHDNDSEIYGQHYHYSNLTEYGETTAGSDYWYVYNNVLFMHMNSNSGSIAEHREFINEAVTLNPDVDWKLVVFHHSIYSAASHATQNSILTRRENYVPIFEEFDIDVVLMGHDHVYVRSYIMEDFTPIESSLDYVQDPKGILYMTFNSGSGSKYYNITGEYEYAAVQSQEKIPTISNIDISKDELKITTHRIDDEMSVLDEFTIYKAKTIENSSVQLAFTKATYNGNKKYPKVTVTDENGNILVKNVDYKITYEDNINVGTAKITIKGIRKYEGTITKTFEIVPQNISTGKIDIIPDTLSYNGKYQTPSVTVIDKNGKVLTSDDYTLEYLNNKNAGVANVIIEGVGNYKGKLEGEIIIKKARLENTTITLSYSSTVFNGGDKTPRVNVKTAKGTTLVNGKNYTVTYENNRNAGIAKVIVTGIGNYEGTQTLEFTITPKDITKTTATLSNKEFKWTGKEINPTVKVVTEKGTVLANNKNYTVTYKNNIGLGIATAVITGIGNYDGTIELDYSIYGDLTNCTAKLKYTKLTYNGNIRKPVVTVTDINGDLLVKNTDYKVKYENNVEIGIAKVIITGIANYKGEIIETFTIVPPEPTNLEMVKTTDSSIKISFDRNEIVDKYYIYVNGKYAGAALKNDYYTIKGLEEDTTYKITVKAVKVVDDKNILSINNPSIEVSTR